MFSETDSTLPNPVTVQQAIGNLPILKAGEGDMILELEDNIEPTSPYEELMMGNITFDEFYKIPIRESATSGVYEQGPKYAFFEKLLHYCSSSRLWIEDLGDIQKETRKLKEHYNFIGQNIVVHSIDLRQGIDSGSSKTNIVNYLTNHDTETIVGWYGNLNFFQKRAVRRMLILEGANKFKINKAMIKHCMKSNANVVVIQVQDILGLSNIARINMPGISSEHNWSWKLTSFDQLRKNIKYFAKL